MKSRRQFFKLAGAGLLAAGATNLYGSPSLAPPANVAAGTLKIGMAGYTFREFSIEETIEMMKKTGVNYLSLKDFHLPMNSSREQIDTLINRFREAGIEVYTVGVVYMKSEEEVSRAFEYAKMAGVRMIVGAPDYKLLPFVEKKVKQYDIRLAIHNHGPDNPLYPNAEDIWEHVKDLDKRMGICIDIGHTKRDGQDPAVDIERYGERIFDAYVKDVDGDTKEGKCIEMGRGIIDIPAVVASLRKLNYTGLCSLEYEKNMKDPLAGIAESIGYFKGVMTCR